MKNVRLYEKNDDGSKGQLHVEGIMTASSPDSICVDGVTYYRSYFIVEDV